MWFQVHSVQANIPKIFFLNGSWMFLLIMPVLVPFFHMHGLTMEQVYLLVTVFATSVVLLEVPSGYLSDLMGRKKTLVWAGFFLGLAFTCLAMSKSFVGFLIFELLRAIAISLFSGTDVALIYDSLEQSPQTKWTHTAILGRKIYYSQVGETVASLLGGLLAGISLMLPAQINALVAWLPFLIALTLCEPARQKLDRRRHFDNMRYIYRELFTGSKLLRLILANYISFGLASYVVIWAFQGFWMHIDIPLSFFGYLWAGYNLAVAFSGRIAHLVERQIGAARTLVVMAMLPIVGFAGMAAFPSFLGILFGFAFQVCRGLNQVVLRDALNARVKADMRATANSVASLGVRMSFALFGPLMGHLIDVKSYSFAFSSFATIYVVFLFLITLPLIAQRRLFRPPAN